MDAMNAATVAAVHPLGHAHDADLEACLGFVNTESYDDGVPNEHIATARDAIAWFAAHGLAHEPALRVQVARDEAGQLARVHRTRAAVRAVWDAEVEHRSRTRARWTP